MSQKQEKPGKFRRTVRLFLIIFAVLLVPLVLDQANVDRESVRLVGRIAGGITVLLFFYGVFTKVLKVMGFVVVVLITLVVLSSEGQLQLPRISELIAERKEGK